jgi:hypothetical protein
MSDKELVPCNVHNAAEEMRAPPSHEKSAPQT